MRQSSIQLLIIAGLLIPSGQTLAYDLDVHRTITETSMQGRGILSGSWSAPRQGELDDLRDKIHRAAGNLASVRTAFPTAADLDARAFKRLLWLNPDRLVNGFDETADGAAITDRLAGMREASIWPDEDHRNQDRLRLDEQHQDRVVLDAYGQAVPEDPMIVWYGARVGTASQMHAHSALSRKRQKSGSLWRALTDPRNFARPEHDLGYAPEFTQIYTELATLSELDGLSPDRTVTYLGGVFHHLEDLGNQVHATQVGSFKFFLDAKKADWFGTGKPAPKVPAFVPLPYITRSQVEAAMPHIRTGKTQLVDPAVLHALDKLPKAKETDVDHATRIISNHHFLVETFFQDEFMLALPSWRAGNRAAIRPGLRAAFEAMEQGDAAFETRLLQAIDAARQSGQERHETEYGRIIAEELADISSTEAQEMFEAIRRLSIDGLKKGDVFDGNLGHKPVDFMKRMDGPDVELIFELHARAFGRVSAALRVWQSLFNAACIAPDAAERAARFERLAQDLVQRQLAGRQVVDERRRAFIQERAAAQAKEQAAKNAQPGFFGRAWNWVTSIF